jgi:hypothetical protein
VCALLEAKVCVAERRYVPTLLAIRYKLHFLFSKQ